MDLGEVRSGVGEGEGEMSVSLRFVEKERKSNFVQIGP
jgi:hypothetical protein